MARANAEQPDNVVDIGEWQVEQFMRQLRDRPFVAVVLGPEGAPLRIFFKGDENDPHLRKMIEAIQQQD